MLIAAVLFYNGTEKPAKGPDRRKVCHDKERAKTWDRRIGVIIGPGVGGLILALQRNRQPLLLTTAMQELIAVASTPESNH
jgi:hypothetical protein